MSAPERIATLECESCGSVAVFRAFEGGDEALGEMIEREAWTSVGADDLCPECSGADDA